MSVAGGRVVGRFAPSPTGALHVGNLRTALAASISARSASGGFVLRFEDLDRVTSDVEIARGQLRDLGSIGIEGDGPPIHQGLRFDLYEDAIRRLVERDLAYECYCTRREVSEAASAPHGTPHLYPGTCRGLSAVERENRRRERPPALRLRSDRRSRTVDDRLHGRLEFPVDDVVLRRNDGVPSYNLAVVVDDGLQGVTEVVRGGDLLPVTASQIALQQLLGIPTPDYVHIPLVVGPDGERLSKRHGAVTLADLASMGWTAPAVRSMLLDSLGQRDDGTFDVGAVPRQPFVFDPAGDPSGRD